MSGTSSLIYTATAKALKRLASIKSQIALELTPRYGLQIRLAYERCDGETT